MANWSNPTNTTSYLDVLVELKARDVDALTMLETTGTNVPEHAIRFVRRTGANSEKIAIQEWDGSSWETKVVEADSIDAGGSLGTMSTQNSNNVNITGGSVAAGAISGTLSAARIPNLNASKINAGTLNADRIPSLSASKVTSGSFTQARIPNLAASKITSGTFNSGRIPNLNANKLTSGTLAYQRLPDSDNARNQLGLGSAATQDSADILEVVNATPVNLAPSDNNLNATGITIPNSGQVLALSYETGNNHYFLQLILRADLITTNIRTAGDNESGKRIQLQDIALQRTASNELLIARLTTNVGDIDQVTLYIVRQVLG